MATEILMPKLGLTMTTGTVLKWLKDEGDAVGYKEVLLEIETEKLSYNVESPAKGALLRILAEVGEKYPVSSVLGYIGEPGEAVPDTYSSTPSIDTRNPQLTLAGSDLPSPPADSQHAILKSQLPISRTFVTPVAKKMAADKGIDYKQIKGTGPNGRIVKADVLAFENSMKNMAIPKAIDYCAVAPGFAPTSPGSGAHGTVIPYKGMRRIIGETMQKAWATIPMVTHHVSAYAGALLDYRVMLNTGTSDKNDRITIGELILKLTAIALARKPIMNSSLTDEGIVIHKGVHLGVATALAEGLIVPVIRDADRKGLLALSQEAKDLAGRAKSGTLSPDDIQGATFTVTNLGGFGSVDYFTPIINPPQAAILGVGRVNDAVAVLSGEMKIRPMMGLSLTYDHRIIDGATAAEFTKDLMNLIENPIRALLF